MISGFLAATNIAAGVAMLYYQPSGPWEIAAAGAFFIAGLLIGQHVEQWRQQRS